MKLQYPNFRHKYLQSHEVLNKIPIVQEFEIDLRQNTV